MLHSLSESIADFLLSKNCFEKDNRSIYVYGTELVLSSLTGILIILILSIALNCFVKGLLFYLAFFTLRSYVGGLHCNTHLRCNLTFIAVFLICVFSDKFLQNFLHSKYVIFLMIFISMVIIAVFAPIENVHKPIDKEEKKRFKKISLVVYAIHLLLYVALCCFLKFDAKMIIITDFLVALTMLAGMFSNKRRCNNNESS